MKLHLLMYMYIYIRVCVIYVHVQSFIFTVAEWFSGLTTILTVTFSLAGCPGVMGVAGVAGDGGTVGVKGVLGVWGVRCGGMGLVGVAVALGYDWYIGEIRV